MANKSSSSSKSNPLEKYATPTSLSKVLSKQEPQGKIGPMSSAKAPMTVAPKPQPKTPPNKITGGGGGGGASQPASPLEKYATPTSLSKILSQQEKVTPIKQVSSTDAGKQLQQLAGSPQTTVSKKVAEVSGTATTIQKARSGLIGITGRALEEGKVLISPKVKPTPIYRRETRTDLAPTVLGMNVYSPGTIYKSQTGSAFFQGKNIPIYKTYTVGKPNKETGIYEGWSSSISTDKEIKQYNDYMKSERFREVSLQKPRTRLQNVFGEAKGRLQIWGSEPFISDEEIKRFKEGNKGGKVGGLWAGGIAGFIPRTKGELGITALTFGVGAGIGAGVKGGSFLLSKIPKAGGFLSSGFKLGAYGTGAVLTGAYALNKVSAVSFQKDYFGKGEIIGGSIRELGALGIGYGVGSKGFLQVKGLIETRGLKEIPLERLTQKEVIEGTRTFPTAPTSTHLKLFKETIIKIPELTQGRAGGFHTTGDKFWSKEIKPKAGSSELPGLYVSSELSPNFLRLGKGGYSFNFPTIKSIISGDAPAIAFLKPKGFREVGFRKVSPYKIDKQTFRFAFKKPALAGFIDIPKMKTEIEGVARIGAGAYPFESRKYYTTVKGVRIPIDVFKTEIKEYNIKLKNQPSKYLKAEDYYLPEKQSLTDVTSNLKRIFKGSSYTSRPSSYISSIISSASKQSSKVSRASSLSSLISRPSSRVSRRSSKLSYPSYPSYTSYISNPSSPTSYLGYTFFPYTPPPTIIPSFKFPKPKPFGSYFNQPARQRKFYVSSIVGILSGRRISKAPGGETSGLGWRLPVIKSTRGVKKMARKKKKR